MFKFFNGIAYDADIAALRGEFPELQSFDHYLISNGWENAERIPEIEQPAWSS